MDLLTHFLGMVSDYLGQAGSRWAWACLLGCMLLIAVTCAWLLSRQG